MWVDFRLGQRTEAPTLTHLMPETGGDRRFSNKQHTDNYKRKVTYKEFFSSPNVVRVIKTRGFDGLFVWQILEGTETPA